MNKRRDFSDHPPAVVKEASAAYRLSVANAALVKPGYKMTEVGVIPEDWPVGAGLKPAPTNGAMAVEYGHE